MAPLEQGAARGRAVLQRDGFSSSQTRDTRRSRPHGEIIDFSTLEFEDKNPFHGRVTHRRRWLWTTTLAGLTSCGAIGLVLSITFGIGSLDGPAVASQQVANLWQRPVATVKTDRVLEFASEEERAALAKLIEEKPYKRVSGEVVPTEPRAPRTNDNGLIGSLAPEYHNEADQGGGDVRLASLPERGAITGAAPIQASLGTSVILPPTSTGEQTEAASDLPDSGLIRENIKLTPDSTLFQRLTEQGAKKADAQRLIAELESLFPTRYLNDGQNISVTYKTIADELGRESKLPVRLVMAAGSKRQIVIRLDSDGNYTGFDNLVEREVADAGSVRKSAKIRTSLYAAAKEQGIPEPVIIEMMRIHAYHVDFQREIHPGDTFEVFYSVDKNTTSRRRRSTVLYSSLTLSGETKGFYRFAAKDGIVDYFDENGQSASKFLMRTPVKATRITSSFGRRRHPVLGYTKMHTGVDFGAPHGTPVRAGGSGIIEKIGRYGAYGKYVRLRHVNGYKTAYAHMSGFATGLSAGERVRQGQVIGYVGSTGRSTGPHLHYEIMINNQQVNPMTVKLPTGRKLADTTMTAFKTEKARINGLRQTSPAGAQIASVVQEIPGRGGP